MKRTAEGGISLKSKLTNKEIVKGVISFIFGMVFFVAVLFLMLMMSEGSNVFNYITQNSTGVITVSVTIGAMSAITYTYFWFENKEVLAKCSQIFEIYILFSITLAVSMVVGKYIHPVARPGSFVAMMLIMLFRRRDAIFLNTIFAIIVLVIDRYINAQLTGQIYISYAVFLSNFCSGIVAIFIFKNVKTRMGSVMAALVIFLPVIVINASMLLPNSGELSLYYFLNDFLLYSVLDCLFSVILFFLLLPVFEIIFKHLTPFRLRELTSENAKIIKMLKKNALGTYNHSVVVAQLAEACAAAIGEDPEMARAAAYYHDVGKLKNPEMFAENQSEINLHQQLTPELSVDIIRSHTRDGAKLIKKNHLPEFLADVAIEHHGTLPIKYFYAKALKMSDGELRMGSYSYSGPTPTTKIAAIIMIADASEAATRALPERTHDKVEALVKSIIEERMNLDQFADCDITMRELSVIAATVVIQLTGVYHSRVEYPKLTVSNKNR